MVVGNLLPPCELKFGMQQSTLPTSLTVLELMITQRVIWKPRSMRPAPAKLGAGTGRAQPKLGPTGINKKVVVSVMIQVLCVIC